MSATPGPWRAVGSTVLDSEGRLVALLYGQPAGEAGLDSARADAALVAAAPDLLDACRRLLCFNEELCADVGVSMHYPSAEAARAAIARAAERVMRGERL